MHMMNSWCGPHRNSAYVTTMLWFSRRHIGSRLRSLETPGVVRHQHGEPPLTRVAGILILVRSTWCASSLLQSNIVVPGRVIHVRVPVAASGDKAVDLVGVYQHAWNCQIPQAEMLAKREKILLRFSQTISILPHRNQLVVAGDFNVSAFPLQRHIGPQVRLSSNPLPDCEFFCSMIQGLNLVILNSWTKAASGRNLLHGWNPLNMHTH